MLLLIYYFFASIHLPIYLYINLCIYLNVCLSYLFIHLDIGDLDIYKYPFCYGIEKYVLCTMRAYICIICV